MASSAVPARGPCATASTTGPLQDDERNILANLAETLALAPAVTEPVLAVMDVLHARVLDPQTEP